MGPLEKAIVSLTRLLDEVKGLKWESEVLNKYLDENKINVLILNNILKPRLTIKDGSQIEVEGRLFRVKVDRNRGKILFIDVKETSITEADIKDYMVYDVTYDKLATHLLLSIFDKSAHSVEVERIELFNGFIRVDARISNVPIAVLVQYVKFSDFSEILVEIARCAERRIPVLLITSSHFVGKLMEYLSLIAVGSLINVITFIDIFKLCNQDDKEVKDHLFNWMDYISFVLDLENRILSEIRDKKFTELRNLLIKVDTNPKYMVTLLYLFKTLRRIKNRDKVWRLLEDLVSIALAYLYGGEVKGYGYKEPGKRVPDNIFVIRTYPGKGTGKVDLIGVVDAKSTRLHLSVSDVAKYLKYFEDIRRIPVLNEAHSIVLYFVTTDKCQDIKNRWERCKSGEGIKGFYQEISKNLNKNEYIEILPLDSLIVLIDSYLSAIRRIEISLSKTGIYETFRQVLLPTNNPAAITIGDKLYCIDATKLCNTIAEKVKDRYIQMMLR